MSFIYFSPQNIEMIRIIRFVLVLGLVCTICEARSNYCNLCDNHIACGNSGVSLILFSSYNFAEPRLVQEVVAESASVGNVPT